MMQSQYRLITLAVSLMVSPTRSWMSLALRKMGCAPSCSMPTSKLMRVRVLVFMKIIVTVRPVEERLRGAPLLRLFERVAQVEQGDDLGRLEVVDGEEAAAGEVELGEMALGLLGHGTPFAGWERDPPRKRRGGGRTRSAPGPRRVTQFSWRDAREGYQMNLCSRRMSSSVGLPISWRS